jgi:hypothetical protein
MRVSNVFDWGVEKPEIGQFVVSSDMCSTKINWFAEFVEYVNFSSPSLNFFRCTTKKVSVIATIWNCLLCTTPYSDKTSQTKLIVHLLKKC